jgi:hypothetical protein
LIREPSVARRFWRSLTGAGDYAFTCSLLWLHDQIGGPPLETPTDRAIREEGERLRKAFPQIDFDQPRPRIIRPAGRD